MDSDRNSPTHRLKSRRSVDSGMLVRLREAVGRPPLFFIPAGHGDLGFFRKTAGLLDGRQPVCALRPPEPEHVEGLHSKTLDWLISMYVEEIKRVQPAGPYHLSGYSCGGTLAVETARELIGRGDEIALLVVLDPPLHLALWFRLFHASLYKLCNLNRWTDTIRLKMIRRWNVRALRLVSDEGIATHVALLGTHEVAPYPGSITCIRPRKSWIDWLNLTCIGNSWHKVARGGLDVHWIPGAHGAMLRGKQADLVAGILRDCLERDPARGPT